MAALMHSESRRLYSWWWDSHISPKNSKWLQDNLTDIDGKVKAMIKLINEDADSFARRAEMYYKKRPELMKLVEEFYRAYRALAERYDHATGELRQAHRTMTEAFPNQVPFLLNDDTPSSSEPQSPQTSAQICAFLDPNDSNKESNLRLSRKGLKQLNEMFQAVESMARESKSADRDLKPEAGVSLLLSENQNLKAMVANESERAGKAEAEIRRLKEVLAEVEVERDGILGQYKASIENLTNLEKELGLAQKDVRKLNKLANEAGYEVRALKEALQKVEAERDCSLSRYSESSKRVATLESMLAALQEDSSRLSQQAARAETESENIKEELSRSEAEKKFALARYEECLEKIFSLENRLLLAEENAKLLREQNEKTENEVKSLMNEISRLKKEKEDMYLRYQECLNTISKLQTELREAKEDVKSLNSEVLWRSAKLQRAEDQCASLQKMNESLKLEADDLAQRIATKDQLLSKKQDEFEKLMTRLHDEQSRFLQVEATLQTLQNLHSQSQEDQRALALELRNGLQLLKDLELCKRDLEGEIKDLREENRELNELKVASSTSEKTMEVEISNLREIKEKLEAEVIRQTEQNDAIQQQALCLKQEIEELYKKYQDVHQQIESSGIDPKFISSSFKDLKEENLRLQQMSGAERTEKEALMKRLADVELLLKKSAILESTLSDVNAELESSKEKVKSLQHSYNVLSEEKATLVGEKSALLSQLQMVTESMQKLLEKNSSLENLLRTANSELEGLRLKSKSLEELCQLLSSERSNLLTERSNLASRLEYVEKKLENLETRFTTLEDKYVGLEKQKEYTLNQVDELRVSLVVEKEQHKCLALSGEKRLSGLEDQIQDLQQENKSRKKEFEEQLDKAVNAQVEIFILQKFMQDMEQKNNTLMIDCQKHVEAAEYSELIISDLESENMMYHVETEFLLDRMAKLRAGICQVLKSLEIDHVNVSELENLLPVVPGNIKQIRRNLLKITDDNHELLVENDLLYAVIKQLNLEGLELASCKDALDREFSLLNQKNVLLEHENASLVVRSREVDMVMIEKEREQETLTAELEILNSKQAELQREYAHLQEQHVNAVEANTYMQGKSSFLEVENRFLEEENDSVTIEALSVSNHCVVYKCYGVEKALEVDRVARDMHNLLEAYRDLENEVKIFRKMLDEKETENLLLRESIQRLEEKKRELCNYNDQLNFQIQSEKILVNQKEAELSEAILKVNFTEHMNAEMHRTVEGLQKQCESLETSRESLQRRIHKLCVDKEQQGKEIGRLQEDNERLASEIDELSGEIEEYKIREVVLSSELNERSCEFELWEAEAASFYFDLQISSVREVLLESKVNELSGLCESLEDVSSRRSLEIERMEVQISSSEGEIDRLKAQLDAYVPVIASLKENISCLEQNLIKKPKLPADGSLEPEVETFTVHEIKEVTSVGPNDPILSAQDNLSVLQELQARIKTIESTLLEENIRSSKHERVKSNDKLDTSKKEAEGLKLKIYSHPGRNVHESERKPRSNHGRSVDTVLDQSSEMKNGAQMKDILLDHVSDSSFSSNRRRGSGRLDDQMLEIWENQERSSGRDLMHQETQPRRSGSGSRKSGNLHHQREIREERHNMGSSQMEKELGVDKMEITKILTESNHGGNSKKVLLERLASDAELLMNLQISLQESWRKMETEKWSKNSSKGFEYKRLRTQLEEVETSVNELVAMNAELVRTAKAGPTSSESNMGSPQLVEAERAQRKKVSERARMGSERIAGLQLEMQKIQYSLIKMEEEQNKNFTNNSCKKINVGRSKFSRSRPGIILSNFIYSRGRRSPRKQKKPRFCGCFKQSHKEV